MKEMTKDKAMVDLVGLRDGLVGGVQKIACEEAEKQAYTDGVLDMYNGFIKALSLESKGDTEVSYEGEQPK